MPIAPRSKVAPAARPARRAAVRKPPTQGQLTIAAYRLADELGGRKCDQAMRDVAAADIYAFASKSVATAWSVVDASVVAVRCYQGRRKISGARGEVVGPFREQLQEAKDADLKRRGEILESLKVAEGEAKAALETELKELTLRGLPEGRPLRLGPAASAFLLDAMRREFLPVKGSPLADEDFPRFVEGNVRLLDWLSGMVFSEAQVSEYTAAYNADKAIRAEASATPAHEADATEESDSDEADEEGDQAASA